MVADQAASKFNVTWSRITPIAVSVCDDAYDGYMTLECDHRFGMDVTGDSSNVYAFRFACSLVINPIEHSVMKTLFPSINSSFTGNISEIYSSITISLGQKMLNGEMPNTFMSNGYIVIKSVDNHLFLVIDPVTGIVRDVMVTNPTFSYGSWCYSDQQTEWASELAEKLNGTNLSIQPDWLKSTYEISMRAGLVALGTGAIAESAGTAFGTGTLIGTGMLLTIAAYAMPITAGVVVACVIFEICVDQGWLPPEKCREICGNAFLPFALINTFIYDEPTPTIQQLKETYWKTSELLRLISENEDEESYDVMFGYPHTPSGLAVAERYEHLFAPPPIGGDNDEDMTEVGKFIREKLEKTKEKWNDGDFIGAMKEFKWVIAGSSVITLKLAYENLELIEEFIKNISKSSSARLC
ncbi:MAG: hypothetical protein HVN35_03395 [Methanobacteriaceae archaeon]|nr:hypothetical protein [Methanobacteriaceae archaeon]